MHRNEVRAGEQPLQIQDDVTRIEIGYGRATASPNAFCAVHEHSWYHRHEPAPQAFSHHTAYAVILMATQWRRSGWDLTWKSRPKSLACCIWQAAHHVGSMPLPASFWWLSRWLSSSLKNSRVMASRRVERYLGLAASLPPCSLVPNWPVSLHNEGLAELEFYRTLDIKPKLSQTAESIDRIYREHKGCSMQAMLMLKENAPRRNEQVDIVRADEALREAYDCLEQAVSMLGCRVLRSRPGSHESGEEMARRRAGSSSRGPLRGCHHHPGQP